MPDKELIPQAYTSTITLFECPGCIAKYTLSQFIELFHGTGIVRSDYVHELWRTGRLELVYGILMHPKMTIKLEDIVKVGNRTVEQGADLDETEAFFTDVVSTIVKVKNDMGYEDTFAEATTEAIRLKAEEMMAAYEEDKISIDDIVL